METYVWPRSCLQSTLISACDDRWPQQGLAEGALPHTPLPEDRHTHTPLDKAKLDAPGHIHASVLNAPGANLRWVSWEETSAPPEHWKECGSWGSQTHTEFLALR